MRINTNLIAQNTYTQYTKNNSKISSSVAKLSSGYAINSAADNAAGLAISEKMRAQIRGLDKASSNAQDAVSLVQSADGALSSSTEILQRMRELAVQSSSDTNNDNIDRTALQDEFGQLQSELNSISSNTTFNKKNLLDGSLASSTKSVSNQSFANTGLTVNIGKAAAGTYNFSVSTKLKSDAVTAVAPSTPQVTLGTDGYFTAGSGTMNSTTKSALLNGNYSLSAAYSTNTNQMTVTATGDNGQTFTSTIDQSTLSGFSSSVSTPLAIKFESSTGANDGFTVNLTLKNTMSSSTDNYNTLASEISKTTTSVSGGVTGQAATYGVFANLTGADSVELQSGQSSVSFDNGVKINFSTLSSSNVSATGAISSSSLSGFTHISTVTGSSSTLADGSYTLTAVNDAYTLNASSTNTGSAATVTGGTANVGTITGTISSDGAAAAVNNGNGTTDFAKFTINNTTYTADLAGSTATAAGVDKNVTFSDGNGNSFVLAINTSGVSTVGAALAGATATLKSTTAGSGFSATLSNGTASYSATLPAASTAVAANGKFALDFSGTGATKGYATVNFTTDPTGIADGTAMAKDMNGATMSLDNKFNFESVFANASGSTASSFDVKTTANAGLTFQVGANEGDTMTINIEKMDANTLGVSSAGVATKDQAAAAIKSVDSAINEVSAQRATLGAIQNRLTYKIDNLNTSNENLTAAESQIRDVDMAKEMTNFTNANILQQAATAMLAQANSLPQNVLSLLK